MCAPGSKFRVTARALVAALLTAAPWWTAGVQARGADRLTITSPLAGFVTSGDLVQVGVTFRADTKGRGTPSKPRPDTLVLFVDGVEVERVTEAEAFGELTRIFTVDLSARADGPVTLVAEAYRRRAADGSTQRLTTVARSAGVTIRLDRVLSDGVPVGPAGATLISDDGALTLAIPEHALEQTQQLSVRKIDPSTVPPLPNHPSLLAAYELLPHDLQFSRPVTASLALDQSARAADGSFGHEAVELFSISGDLVEGLEGQTVVDGTSGLVGVTGSMLHFSTLTCAVTNQLEVSISGVPESVRVGEPFDVAARAIDDVAGTLLGLVMLEDVPFESATIERISPDPTEPTVPLGFFEPAVANDYAQNLTYRCTRPGVNVFNVVVRPEPGAPRINLAKFMFCATDDMIDGVVTSNSGGSEAMAQPVQSVHSLDMSFTVRLAESAGSAGSEVIDVTVFDLFPGILEGPALSPTETANVLRAGLVTQLTEPLELGLAEQELGYVCRNTGTTILGLRFLLPDGDLWLQSRVQCQP